MAAEERVKAQIVVVYDKKCELCDTNDILWICLNCDELICDFCKCIHLKSKMTRNHKVEYLGEADKRPSCQPDKPSCSAHTDEDIQMFCKPCSKPICRECIASEAHLSHKLVKIEDVIQSVKNELSNILAQSKTLINTRKDSIKQIEKNQTENLKQISFAIEEIKGQNTLLKQIFDKITDDFIEEILQLHRKNKEKTRRTQRQIEDEISTLKCLMEQCKKKKDERPLDLIQFVTDTKKVLEDLKSADPPNLHNPPQFAKKDVDEQKLKAVFGDLDFKSTPIHGIPEFPAKPTHPLPTFDVIVISNFEVEVDYGIIAAVNDNQAWLCTVRDRTIRLVTSEGDEVRRITTDFDVCDIAVTKSGTLLATVSEGHAVKKLTSNRTSVDLWTSDYQAYKTSCITVTNNDDIVVSLYCVIEDGDMRKHQYKVLQLSSSGELIRVMLQYNGTEQTSYIHYNPCSVNININGDIIVGLWVEECVIVMGKSGGKRFTYNGQVHDLERYFSPWYSVTDKYGHILISDLTNSAVHLLDKDGNFIKLLVTKQHGLDCPTGMSVDTSGRLWIWHGKSWQSNGKVMVTEYL